MTNRNYDRSPETIKSLIESGEIKAAVAVVDDCANRLGDESTALLLARLNGLDLAQLSDGSGDASTGSLVAGILSPTQAAGMLSLEPVVWERDFLNREQYKRILEGMRNVVASFISSRTDTECREYLQAVMEDENGMVYLACALVGSQYIDIPPGEMNLDNLEDEVERRLADTSLYEADWLFLKLYQTHPECLERTVSLLTSEVESTFGSMAERRVLERLKDLYTSARAEYTRTQEFEAGNADDMFSPLP